SPTKWHLAHTTWFFETFLLTAYVPNYRSVHDAYAFLFNSYYEGAGPRHTRSQRGLLSRPSVDEVYAYRHEVDRRMRQLMNDLPPEVVQQAHRRITIGLHHEQQHQELLLMDIKHVFSLNPLRPEYLPRPDQPAESSRPTQPPPLQWLGHDGGLVEVGSTGGFSFDNETPRHKVHLDAFQLTSRPVTNAEYLEFIRDRGYERPDLWLSDGWSTRCTEQWTAPLYWYEQDGQWMEFTLHGARPIRPCEPVVHVSLYEADAFARWAGYRLPTEFEWEIVASLQSTDGQYMRDGLLHPVEVSSDSHQFFGSVWEHTQSPYSPYPRFKPLEGTLGEYNGKFMCNQNVLRGGSCMTPNGHLRASYRNFFYPHQRWSAMGIRLAKDV
ncbi:MAG: ergothioneine biosynthesis protein EgtB, partial [Myxococcota bacterium]